MRSDYFSLALKNLRRRGLRSWLTLLGIVIGITAVIALIALGQGLEQAISGQFSGIAADRLVVTNSEAGFGPPGSTTVRKLTSHDQKLIERVPGVISTIPRLIRVTSVEYNRQKQFIFVGSLPKEQEAINFIYTTFQINTAAGKLLKSSDLGSVMLGSDIAKEIQFNKEVRVGTHIKIQGKDFEVAGILEPLGNIQFNHAIFMPENDMKDILGIDDEIDVLIVKVESVQRSEEISADIARKLRKDRHEKEGEEDFSVQTPVALLSSVTTILKVINLVISGIAAIALLIGAIGVSNTMFTAVIERRKEIGVMKAVGAHNKDILLLFLIESALLGLIGGVLGILIGIALAYTAAYAANLALGTTLLQASFSLPLMLAAVIFTFLLGLLAGMIPAWQASRLPPTEALRR